MGVQVGSENTLIIYNYGERTLSDKASLPSRDVTVVGNIKSPYQGLRAFGVKDEPFFFGREEATATVLARLSDCLHGSGLLVVSGVSGAGKSSLLQAGMLSRIRGEGLADAPGAASWQCWILRPGPDPLTRLALWASQLLPGTLAVALRRELDSDPGGFAVTARQAALAQPADQVERIGAGPVARPGEQRRLLLIVDQFEQVFTQCEDERQRRAFITALSAAAAGDGHGQEPAALVVLGVRADFEARCADYPELDEAVQRRYLLTAMTQMQLRQAITEPARRIGGNVAPDLVELLLQEVRTRQPASTDAGPAAGAVSGAGVLPLLSHALDEAWRKRAGDELTVADYERIGGIEGAVKASAEKAYNTLTAAQQTVCRQLFIRLTATTADGVNAARRVRRAELAEGMSAEQAGDEDAVIEAFVAERLLTVDADSVEISHEVLLRSWPMLRDEWLGETLTDRIALTRLRTTAEEWQRESADSSYLYSGSLLETAEATVARADAEPARYPSLSHTERDFLHASERARTRRNRVRQGTVAFLLALVVGLAAVAVIAARARQSALRARDTALSGKLVAQSEATGNSDPVLARLESIAAWRLDPTEQARYAMLSAARLPGIAALAGSGASVNGVAFSPDGAILAAGSGDGLVRLWNPATRREIGRPLGVYSHAEAIFSIAFSPDGKVLAAAGRGGDVRLWDVASHQQVGTLAASDTSNVLTMAFSRSGTILAVGRTDGTVQLWDAATGQPIGGPLSTGSSEVLGVAFSPDGSTLATADGGEASAGVETGAVRLWDVSSRRPIGAPLATYPFVASSLAFSPDGKYLATGWSDDLVNVYDVATRGLANLLIGDGGEIDSLAYSPDGLTLAGGTYDGAAVLWDVNTDEQLGGTLSSDKRPVETVAFSPDGQTLATGSTDGTTRLWSVAAVTGERLADVSIGSAANSVAFSPAGRVLAVGSSDGDTRLLDAATLSQVGTPLADGTGRVDAVAFSPSGQVVAAAGSDGATRLWDVASGRLAGTLTDGAGLSVDAVAFSPDGKVLATGDSTGVVRLWDVATGKQIRALDTGDWVYSVAFSPNGKTLATGSYLGVAELWDVATGRQIGALSDGQTWTISSVAFSPDGQTVATGSSDETARLWDLATGRQIGGALSGDTNWVSSVAFSPDGQVLATGSYDGTARLWDVATLQPIGGPISDGDGASIDSVAFSPDGQTLATAGYNGLVQLWDVSYLTRLVPYLCASAEQTLSHRQWTQLAPGPAYQDVCP